jgi:N,N-dimethylformamidase
MNTIPLIGYAEQLSGRPGDTIEFKVSSTCEDDFEVSLVKVISADPNPAGPGIIEQTISSAIDGLYPSEEQPFYPGSYAQARIQKGLVSSDRIAITAIIWPTLLNGKIQTIVQLGTETDNPAICLCLNQRGRLCFIVRTENNDDVVVCSQEPLKLRTWYRVWASYDSHRKILEIGYSDPDKPGNIVGSAQKQFCVLSAMDVDSVTIGGSITPTPGRFFNGKIESPAVYSEALDRDYLSGSPAPDHDSLVSWWDFSQKISTTTIVDIGPAKAHGNIVNLPVRGTTGSNWSGEERDWKHAPLQYGAIYFHEDDIYDFEWQTSFSFTIPDAIGSGSYAVKLKCGEYKDNIPFFVCPAAGKPAAALCLLVSTFTYTIYGNHARPDFDASWLQLMEQRGAYPWNPAAFRQYGLSTYNVHSDGSGICHASCRRPLMTLKSGYVTFPDTSCSGLRHYQADSHLITWLENNSIEYDVITDQELQDQGYDAIAPYRALVTGSHPEYHTPKTLDALLQYRDAGGNFIYLGGNGFYWKVAEHTENKGTLEIRRAEGGIRAWAAQPGEYYNAFDGGYGGLWRRNNRPPQKLAGVGFSAQGVFTGSYYRRTEDSFNNPSVTWIFDGVTEDIIGDFGLSGNGAAGFELDRIDYRLGTEQNTVVLASSENHDSSFVLVPEEQLTHLTTLSGEPIEKLIRADMIYQCSDSGSQLFSTGSITFCGSLLHEAGDNNISRILSNVIYRFLQ